MKKEILSVFDKHNLPFERMIGGSKLRYRIANPHGLPVFNANIVTENDGKIWYGDLDLNSDAEALQDIADELKEKLYVLREMDYRFDTEGRSMDEVKRVAVQVFKSN